MSSSTSATLRPEFSNVKFVRSLRRDGCRVRRLARFPRTFEVGGDIEGEGTIRVAEAVRKDGSATFVGIERVRGAVGGRKESFLLQTSGTLSGKDIEAEWFVVPASGTGDLKGLRGEGGFKADVGEHGAIWLDYYFEWTKVRGALKPSRADHAWAWRRAGSCRKSF